MPIAPAPTKVVVPEIEVPIEPRRSGRNQMVRFEDKSIIVGQ